MMRNDISLLEERKLFPDKLSLLNYPFIQVLYFICVFYHRKMYKRWFIIEHSGVTIIALYYMELSCATFILLNMTVFSSTLAIWRHFPTLGILTIFPRKFIFFYGGFINNLNCAIGIL